MTFQHLPVLADQVVALLAPALGDLVVDATLGGGGHAALLAAHLGPRGHLVGLDRDQDAVSAARLRLETLQQELGDQAPRVTLRKAPFAQLDAVLEGLGLRRRSVAILLADLGVSSHQLDSAERGFSFVQDGPLDMRMDRDQPLRAWDLVNDLPQDVLAGIFYTLGDEPEGRRVARAIVERRGGTPFRTTSDLAEVVSAAKGGRRGARIHPATRVFQALRIHLNREGAQLDALLDQALDWLQPGGRLGIVSFHSGEDRVVKERFADWKKPCICPPDLPICACGRVPVIDLPHRKGVVATDDELALNPRARSARLRVAVRLPAESVP